MAWVIAATPIQLVHAGSGPATHTVRVRLMQGSPNDQIAGPGPATRTVNAANALVSLPVVTSKR